MDQTFAEELRARGLDPGPRWEHVLTNSVRETTTDWIGGPVIVAAERLALTTDGVHKVASAEGIRRCLLGPATASRAAQMLAAEAARARTTDNATVLVADLVAAHE